MYYLGFLKQNTKDVVIFKSLKAPRKGDFAYFIRVMGPYQTEGNARKGLVRLKESYGEFGYHENPSSKARAIYKKKGITCRKDHAHNGKCASYQNPLGATVEKAVKLTKKLVRAYDAFRQDNPRKSYHDQKFLRFMGELEKYKVGTPPYIAVLAKAYEHLQSAKDSEKEQVR